MWKLDRSFMEVCTHAMPEIDSLECQGDILVVDDELDNLKLFSTVLSNRGYRVRQATNGEIAMRDSVLVQHLDLLHMQSLCSDISFVSVIFWVG